jgi:lauroyl/myristoyl acyltransferase
MPPPSEAPKRPSSRVAITTLPRRCLSQLSDLVRVTAFLFLGAASHLPRRWALACADAAGFFYYLTPMGARVRASMRAAFAERDAKKLAREWLTRPFRDHVCISRIVGRRDNLDLWPIESRNAPAILCEPGQSVIVATGHFAREAVACAYLHRVVPKRLGAVLHSLDRRSLSPRALRLRIQFGAMVETARRARHDDLDIIEPGKAGVVSRLVHHLEQPDTVVILATDAVSATGRAKGLDRPFAGHRSVSFAFGTARLARLSGRPIVTCVPFLDIDGHVVLEWGEPIPPPARDDDAADARITNAVLDVFERAIGLRPGQFVLPIGHERRWDATAQRWTDLNAPTPTSAARSVTAPLSAVTVE